MTDDPKQSDIIVYTTEDGRTRVLVRVEGGTVWLTQAQLADLFQTTVPNVNMHIKKLQEEGEIDSEATIKNYLIVRSEGTRTVQREIAHYNLDVILPVEIEHPGTFFRPRKNTACHSL